MTRTALALSPHLDDAAFSCGGLLAMLARAGWRVVVATLFTRSVPNPQGFALACQLDKGLEPQVDYMALRRAEDAAAMRALDAAPPFHAPLAEAPHRGYGSAPELFGALRPDDAVGDEVRAVVDRLLAEHSPELVLAPQAIGGHVDHIQVVRALEGLNLPIAWWRDFPYTARTANPREPFGDAMSRLPERSVVLDKAALAAQEASCLAYVSQLGFQFGGADRLRAKLAEAGAIERFRSINALSL